MGAQGSSARRRWISASLSALTISSTRRRPCSLPASGPPKRTKPSSASAFMNAAWSLTAGCSVIPFPSVQDGPASRMTAKFAHAGSGDQVVECVVESIAPVRGAVAGEARADRVLDFVLLVGTDEDGDPGGGDECAPERVLVGVFERPGGVECALGLKAGLRGELLEHAGLGVVGLGWRVRRAAVA